MGDVVQLIGTNAATTIIDATGSGSRVMNASKTANGTALRYLTLRGGEGGVPGIYNDYADLSLYDCVIRDNNRTSEGGGIYMGYHIRGQALGPNARSRPSRPG